MKINVMAKKQAAGNSQSLRVKVKVKRKGVHSKTKASNSKNAKNYTKKYRGQG